MHSTTSAVSRTFGRIKPKGYNDHLVKGFNDTQRKFILEEIYPQLETKLQEMMTLKEKSYLAPDSFKCDIKFDVLDMAPTTYF